MSVKVEINSTPSFTTGRPLKSSTSKNTFVFRYPPLPSEFSDRLSGSAEGRRHYFVRRRCRFILGKLRLFGEWVL